MSVLVTGAAGFVGAHCSLALKKHGDGVLGLDNFNKYYDPSLKRARQALLSKHQIFIVEGDLNDGLLFTKLFNVVLFTPIRHEAGPSVTNLSVRPTPFPSSLESADEET